MTSDPALTFRPCADADLPAFAEMVAGLYAEDPSSSGKEMTPEKARRTYEEFTTRPDKGRIVLFDRSGEAVGYAILVYFWSNEYGGDVIEVDELFVREGHRSSGVATAFFRWLTETKAGDAAAVAVSLQVTADNHRARALYTRLGFHPFPNQHYIRPL